MSQCDAARHRLLAEIIDVEAREVEGSSHVAKLPDVEIIARMMHSGPTPKNVARRLQQALAVHHTLEQAKISSQTGGVRTHAHDRQRPNGRP
jgi:hypothetical protein